MFLLDPVLREFRYIRNILHTLQRIRGIKPDSQNLLTDDLERSVDRYPDNIAFYEGNQKITYRVFEEYANQVAHWAKSLGYKKGDTITLFMYNRWQYVSIWFGLSKLGIITSLVNNQLIGKALSHCVQICNSDLIIMDSELQNTYMEIEKGLKKKPSVWVFGTSEKKEQNFDLAIGKQTKVRPPASTRSGLFARDKILKLFTSGTTGLPKVALITHMRAQNYMHAFSAASRAGQKDRMMMVLPLYHATGGLCGVGSVLTVGGSVIVRREFSASKFWDEAVQYEATLFMYVGEICRFLTVSPPSENETRHGIRCIMGNGMRIDVWKEFIKRFKISNIIEFYGATEGNVSMLNMDGKVGAIGRIPAYLRHRFNVSIIKYNIEKDEVVRNTDGLCIKADYNEAGEAIGEIRTDDSRFSFEGYGDKKDTDKKCLRNVFKEGDFWFRTGDLIKQDKLGYFYFIDRIGDTFRWKAENVAASEVEEVLLSVPGISQAIVYGVRVPDTEGRAGMASLIADPSIDLIVLMSVLRSQLPSYSHPVFLRFQRESEITGTFKYRKINLVKEGFDPEKVKDPLYYLDSKAMAYKNLDKEVYKHILSNKIHF